MLHRAAWILVSVLFLIPGNLMAAVALTLPTTCEDQGCGCPAPKQDTSSPAFTSSCCCEMQPGDAPEDRPSAPLQAPKCPSSDLMATDVRSSEVPGLTSLQVWIGERPNYLAHPLPDPLFLRYQSLRL